MQRTEEWWHRMVEMHAELIVHYDADILEEFKRELDTIHYVYAKPYEGLDKGAPPIGEVAYWYDSVSKWSEEHEDYDAAVMYLERALDYYCDPTLDYNDKIINKAKRHMTKLAKKCILGIYEGCHELYNDL